MWSRQVHALLDGYDLASYIDGSVIASPPTQTTAGVVTTNTAYTLWKRQHRFIYSALLREISTSVQSLLSKANNTAEVWTTLSEMYATPRRGHIFQLGHQIKK